MIALTRGVPAPESYPVDEMVKAFEKAMHEDPSKFLGYVASPGYMPLIELLAEREGVDVDNILIGNSSLEFIQFITMTEAEPGDVVFAESPSYDRVNLLFKRRGLNPVGIPLDIDGMDMNVLEDELKKHAPKFLYAIVDFQNPMGVTYSLEKRKQLVEFARKYNFIILEDLPYRELRYKGENLPTMHSMDPEHVVKMSSFSKTLTPGCRIGYLNGPKDFIKRVKTWAGNTYIGPVSPTQALLYQFIRMGFYEPNLVRIKDLYRPRMEKAIEILERELPTAVFPRPEGGFFIGVTLPEGNDMATLMPAAEAAGVKITDGRGFYLNPEDGKRFLRVPFCGLKPEELEQAFGLLLPLIKK